MDKPETKNLPSPVRDAVAEWESTVNMMQASLSVGRANNTSVAYGGNEQVAQIVADSVGKSGSREL